MKKKFIIGFVFVLVLGIVYFSYKGFLLFNYKVDINDTIKEQLKNSGDTIKITTNRYIDNEKTTEFENVIYKNLEADFVFNKDKSSSEGSMIFYSYYLNDKVSGNLLALFRVGSYDNMYDMLTSDDIFTFNFSFKDTNKKQLLQKYDIYNDFDIYKYIVNHYSDEVNVFSSRDEIKLSYLIKTFANVMIPVSTVSLIDGDIKGYILTMNNNLIYEVHLVHNGGNYAFGFFNGKDSKYFNLDNIKEFLSNVRFKK